MTEFIAGVILFAVIVVIIIIKNKKQVKEDEKIDTALTDDETPLPTPPIPPKGTP